MSAYEAERENWLRNLSAARAARVRALLASERVDMDASEAILRYRLRQHHVGVVCWADEAEGETAALARMALGAHAVALAAGPAGQVITGFADVAPLALMSGSIELLRDAARGRGGPDPCAPRRKSS